MERGFDNLPVKRRWVGTEWAVILFVLPVADSHVVLELQEVGGLPSLNAVA